MSISAMYDFQEDRMKLTLKINTDTFQPLWFSRALWLNLIFIIQPYQQKKIKKTLREDKKNSEKKSKPKNDIQLEPQLVKNIKFKSLPEGIKINLITQKNSNIVITLKLEDIDSFNHMLLDLAERGGWDPFPAIKRFKSRQDAAGAIKHIMNKKNLH
jgi:hypothetical protein